MSVPLAYDKLDEEMLARMLEIADPKSKPTRFADVITVNLSAILIVVRTLLEGQHRGLVIRHDDE